MIPYQQQKQKVLQLFHAAIEMSRDQKNLEIQQQLEKAAKHLAEGKLFVVVCGEFKQGKSSLLNAFLNEPNLFPVDVDITTNLVSTITYGESEKITVIVGEPGKGEAKAIQRSEIPDYVTEQRNQGNARQAQMLIVEASNPQLKKGLVLVDTPGVGSLNTKHTAISYAFIPNADAIVFVSDVLAPLSAKELEFIKERLVPHCHNLIFVVSKIDAVTDYQAVVENNRDKLAAVLGRSRSAITIIPVSSNLKLEYLNSQDPEDLEDSNFATLEKALWKLISEQRGQILLLHALSELSRGVAQLKQPVQAEWESYQQHTQKELDNLEHQYQAQKQRLQHLLDSNADWLTQLSYGLQDIRKQLMYQFEAGFDQIQSQTNAYLDDNRLLANPREIASLIEADIYALMSELGKQLSQRSAELYALTESSTHLSLKLLEVSKLEWNKITASVESEQIKMTGLFEKAVISVRNIGFTAPVGAGIGYWIGGLAGGAIGALFGGIGTGPGMVIGQWIGSTLGGMGGAKVALDQSLTQLKERDKREISKIVLPFVKRSQLLCKKFLDDALTKLEQSMRDELRNQIKQEKETSDRTLRSLQEARKLSQEQAAQRAKELQVQLRQLNQTQKEVKQLAESIVTTIPPASQKVTETVQKPKACEQFPQDLTTGVDDKGAADE
jgi:GTPase Era involved in 16S rRNA processing